jgi:hypothetical protein
LKGAYDLSDVQPADYTSKNVRQKLPSNEKLKPCDAVIARASAIYLLGAPG